MTSALRTGKGGRRGAFACLLAVALVLLAACGQDDEEQEAAPTPVVSGIVLDGPEGDPVPDVELELLVWPSPQASTGGASEAPETIRADTDTTDAAGEFALTALPDELTPHAASDGLVGIEVRVAGTKAPGTRTTVRLQRADDTGVTSVVETSGLVVTVARAGAGG